MPIRLASFFCALLCCFNVIANTTDNTPKTISLSEFLQTVTRSDRQFEAILLDRLPLAYRHATLLPTTDLLIDIKQQFHLYLNGINTGASSSIGLQQLFPNTGTQVNASYHKPSNSRSDEQASLQVLLSQPIARNAFGRAYHFKSAIITVENEVREFQIIEAYEDYLASLSVAWLNWYSAFENLQVAKTSHESSQQLLDNIRERQRQKIALPIDVNKMKLALIAKRENQVLLQEIYDSYANLIFSAMRLPHNQRPQPAKLIETPTHIEFESAYQDFVANSRTYRLLNLLEHKSHLVVKQAADDLLPSTSLLIGYQLDAQQWGLKQQENSLFAGFSVSWPLKRRVEKSKIEIARIEKRKTQLANQNKYEDLRTNLKNLHLQIQHKRLLMNIANEKIQLAEAILKDETENYSFGKVSLNDYIDAVNDVDENRFNYTDHLVKLNKLLIEWKRLSDTLLAKDKIR